MSNPYVAEVRLFGFDFAPAGWALCNGQILPISQHTALFSLLGTTYGGNGTTTFALPNLQASVVMHAGSGPGLSPRALGEQGGAEEVTLDISQIPLHSHTVFARDTTGNDNDATTGVMVAKPPFGNVYGPSAATSAMATTSIAAVGDSLPHTNNQPYLVMRYCIALQGEFPPRT